MDEGAGLVESHPAAKVFPLMDEEGLTTLAEDIAAHGLLSPIELLDGKVIDGRNRQRACRIAGVEPKFKDVDLNGQMPIEYVLSKNLRRRQLSTVQLALLAFDLIPHYRERAEERQRAGRAGLSEDQEDERGYTNEKVARIVGVGVKTVRQVVSISRADQEVLALMREGAFGSVREAAAAAGVRSSESTAERFRRATAQNGDQWDALVPSLSAYLRRWLGDPMEHVDVVEARRRLRQLAVAQRGLDELERQLRQIA